MPRTTLDIEGPVLQELKRLGRREGKSLGQLASALLSDALRRRDANQPPRRAFRWLSRPMEARVDLTDKSAVYDALDRHNGHRRRPTR